MIDQRNSAESFEQEFRQLAEELTEMALVDEELFNTAASALIGHDRSLAFRVTEGEALLPAQEEASGVAALAEETPREKLDTRLSSLMEAWADVPPAVNTLLLVQQAAQELEYIGDHARLIAMQALALTDGDSAVMELGQAAGADLKALIQLVSLQLRGCSEALSAPDVARAGHLKDAHAELEEAYKRFTAGVQEKLASNPAASLGLTRLLSAAYEMHCIGLRIVTICEQVAQMLLGEEPAS